MVSSKRSQVYQDADSFFQDPVQQRPQVVYTKQIRERQVYMEDLRDYRARIEKQDLKKIRNLAGPCWYHVLSVKQREALDTLSAAIYQDLLDDRAKRTSRILCILGIYPPPKPLDVMDANIYGRDDPKKMLAHLFLLLNSHSLEGKRSSYNLNSKLYLSAIYYLGLKNLIELLREKFKPEEKPAPSPKPKPKRHRPVESPYMKRTIIPMWVPPGPKKFTPAPLPQLDELDEPYEESDECIIILKPPPPPPPPPPPKRVPLALCDQLAGVISIVPNTVTTVAVKTSTTTQQKENSKLTLEVKKKTYGICITRSARKNFRRKPKTPSTGINNTHHSIQGVYKIGGRPVYVLGNVSITPAEGELIHGGFAQRPGGYMNVHLGFRGYPPPPPPDPCDCQIKWQDKVLNWVKEEKCYCGHNYDYGNEGTFSPSELPYFQKSTAVTPYQFNYDTIFDIDQKQMFVKKEFKKIWEVDDIIGSEKEQGVKKKTSKKNAVTDNKVELSKKITEVDSKIDSKQDTNVKAKESIKIPEAHNKTESKQDHDVKKTQTKKMTEADNKTESKQDQNVKKKEMKSPKSCLGQNPKPSQYLKCALRLLRRVNVAARLPDVHLAPELLQWMRRRIEGPIRPDQRKAYLRKTRKLHTVLENLTPKLCRSLYTKNNIDFGGATTWAHKSTLREKFNKFSADYKRQAFSIFSNVNNLFWRIMFHSECPDKNFRETFFSYLNGTANDLMLMRPYSTFETQHRRDVLMSRRMICLPDGYEPDENLQTLL